MGEEARLRSNVRRIPDTKVSMSGKIHHKDLRRYSNISRDGVVGPEVVSIRMFPTSLGNTATFVLRERNLGQDVQLCVSKIFKTVDKARDTL